MPKEVISVAITTYKAPKGALLRCLKSLETQTFQDFRVHLYLDGADEMLDAESADLIGRYKWVVYRDGENRGIGARLNFLHKQCAGEFIAWQGSDDVSLPDRFQKQVDFLRANPAIMAISGQVLQIRENGKQNILQGFSTDPALCMERYRRGATGCPSICLMFRKELAVIPLREGLRVAEDTAWGMEVAKKFYPQAVHMNLPDVIAHYHRSGNSATRQYRRDMEAGKVPAFGDVDRALAKEIWGDV